MPPFIRHTHTLQGGAVRGTLKVTNFVSRICYVMSLICLSHVAEISWHDTATHCNTLRHAATQHIQIRASVQHQTYIDNTLQHTATHCNTLQHTATQHIQLKARVQHQRYTCSPSAAPPLPHACVCGGRREHHGGGCENVRV